MRRTPALFATVTGQSLSVRVPNGRPTSATFKVFRNYGSDESVPEFSGAAVVNSVDTTLAAIAGPSQSNPTQLTLASAAGVSTSARYLLSSNGRSEWIDPVEVATPLVSSRFPLQQDFPIGATFQGTYLTAAVDDTWVSALSRMSDLADTTPDYRVTWYVVIGGATRVIYSFFDIVRADSRHHVDISDVNERAFGLLDSLPIEYRAEQGQPIIDGAWRSVRADLIAQRISPDAWRDDEALDELVVLRSLRNLAEGGWSPPGVDKAAYLVTTTTNYDRFFEKHVVTLKHKTSVDLDAMTNPWAPAPIRDMWSK